MKFGIRIPPPQMGPIGDPDFVVRYAQLVESLGFESLWTIDHAVMHTEYDSRYPYKTTGRTPLPADSNMPDPLLLLMFLAAATEKIRLGTAMLILPQRHPVILAKEVATLDQYSKGRLTLGMGIGWVKEEVEDLGQDFSDRGRRANEWIRVMRALWAEGISHFEGEYFNFKGVLSYPKPVQTGGIPLMIGGHSKFAARRAGRYGDEFYPHWSTRGPDAEELGKLWPVVQDEAEKAGRPRDAVSLTLTSTSDAKTALATAEFCAELGAERVVVLPPKGRLDGSLPDELARFREEVMVPLGSEGAK
ncbi:MAG: TIGR03619 family F420-dependent LLM class oxidoreductase [Candidatus Binatia bacterium]|nr:TIGR03619 family F420-dependent LLM class oxidoreductase [Candidatus Binatia bacterium]MDG1960093.1 TIGR03619 family F420-dependent LLM class oxidoreductase [Candidatus Binatia bacterium]MDG2009879.1 TIGR03619 family F420-dependent LLM class oxidoreductase [Candidatus Binatia bacterium]